ncbi:MAG: hypothetical protein LQ345_001203 [Seirophora villosa]|nr:MAG: hypothetical protein LQ345_001203 [Seirophora villosa]
MSDPIPSTPPWGPNTQPCDASRILREMNRHKKTGLPKDSQDIHSFLNTFDTHNLAREATYRAQTQGLKDIMQFFLPTLCLLTLPLLALAAGPVGSSRSGSNSKRPSGHGSHTDSTNGAVSHGTGQSAAFGFAVVVAIALA